MIDAAVTVPAVPRTQPRDLIALAKPRIMVMTLVTAAGAMSLAPGRPDPVATVLLLVGTALIVGAANTFNMVLERDIDCLMARTRDRPLPRGRMSPRAARRFGAVLHALALPVLLAVNPLTALLGVVALLSYVFLYTPLKQRTHWATWIGAVPGALPVLMGWAAQAGTIDLAGLTVFAVLFFWQIPHFHAIALYRRREYERAGLKTLPGTRGERATQLQIAAFLVVQVGCSLALVPLGIAGTTYLAIAIGLGAIVLAQGLPGALRACEAKWARRVFLASLVYLPVLFSAMVLDGRV